MPPTAVRVLRVPCADPQAAADAANHLRIENGLDVLGTDGRDVLVPAGTDPTFVWGVAEQLAPYGHDDELAAWAELAATGQGGV